MKITSARFHRSAADVGSCPQTNLPEVALIGRSNVGKSSLINLLVELVIASAGASMLARQTRQGALLAANEQISQLV